MRKQVLKIYAALLIAFIFAVPALGEDVKSHIREVLDAGDTTRAIQLIKEDIEIDKGYHYNYYTLGRIYYTREQYDKALEQFQIAKEKKSKHYESLYYLGLTYLALGNTEAALETMKNGQKKARDIKDLFDNGYGLVLMKQEKYDDAVAAFMKAQVGHEDNPEYHINLGDAYFYQGVPSLAILEYEKALEIDTGSTEVYFHWAEACFQMKDYACTINKLRTVLSKDSTHAPAWKRAGAIYFKAAMSSRSREERTERFRDAIGSYRKYIELSGVKPDSSTVRVYFELGLAFVNLYGFDDAVMQFENVLNIPMIPKDIYFYYGKSLWGIKEYEKAVEMLKKHLDWATQQEDYTTNIDESEIYQLLGDCYYYRKPNDFYSAVTYYKKSLVLNPDQKRVTQNTAVALHSLKNYAEALFYYDKRIELGIDTTSFNIYKNAGYCALNIANRESGETETDEDILESDEEAVEVSEDLIDSTKNYYEVAVDYMMKYLEYSPQDDKVLLLAANTYLFNLSDCENGVKYYEQLLTVDPNNCVAKRSLGYAYFGGICTKNYTKALRYLLEAEQCLAGGEGECSDVNLLLWVGQCYHLRAVDTKSDAAAAKSDFKNAFDWYSKCLKCDPGQLDCKDGQDKVRFEF
ncbi:MAG: tetratricopeptide repeat protein [Candidatus Zixiibacteriota bacterium]